MKAEDIWAWARRGLCLPCSYELVWAGPSVMGWTLPKGQPVVVRQLESTVVLSPLTGHSYRVAPSENRSWDLWPAAVLLSGFGERHLNITLVVADGALFPGIVRAELWNPLKERLFSMVLRRSPAWLSFCLWDLSAILKHEKIHALYVSYMFLDVC